MPVLFRIAGRDVVVMCLLRIAAEILVSNDYDNIGLHYSSCLVSLVKGLTPGHRCRAKMSTVDDTQLLEGF